MSLLTYRGTVYPWHCDHVGHMNVMWYVGKFDEAILAADRYIAIYPQSKEVPYVLYLKGNSYFGQITDITRDQQISKNAIDTYSLHGLDALRVLMDQRGAGVVFLSQMAQRALHQPVRARAAGFGERLLVPETIWVLDFKIN